MTREQKNAADLQVLAPLTSDVTVGGEHLTLTPIVLGELPVLIKAVQPFAQQLQGKPDWLALLCQHSDAILRALSIASRRPREWIDALSIDDALSLAAAVFEVNADFFIERLVPTLQALAPRMAARWAGQTSSPD